MYSESEIDAAVAAGVMPAQIATDFRNHVATLRAAPAVDEEHFRLLSGFNDIFVSIALVLLLVAVGQLGSLIAAPLTGGLTAAAAWPLALYFTARRRMALPSILLLLTFVGGVAACLFDMIPNGLPSRTGALLAGGAAAGGAIAAWLHWRRFMVPITVAAGAAALVGLGLSLLMAAAPEVEELFWVLLLAGGIAVFALAMHWDLSDRERLTRRADVAFWLHLVAAPMIAHPTFQLLGVMDGDMGTGTAFIVLALYLLFALVAVAVDRRALLVSSLIYVLFALGTLVRFSGSDSFELEWPLTALVIGSALLTLSAFWQPIRLQVIGRLSHLGQRLPPVNVVR